jgi:glycosyltransferase A (GT-A) superfamily protein (DUF2064 family)
VFVLVLAKEPVPGRVKTRLCPPCTAEEAAAIAAAALADTFDAAVSSGAERVLAALDGRPGPWLPPAVEVVPQGTGPLEARLARAWSHTSGPGIQIGMDTPQLTASDLDEAMSSLAEPDVDAVLGPATDGGWWAIGLPSEDERVFSGVPTSRSDTGAIQRRRLEELGYRVADLPTRSDVDHFSEALAVASLAPGTRFAHAVHRTAAGRP